LYGVRTYTVEQRQARSVADGAGADHGSVVRMVLGGTFFAGKYRPCAWDSVRDCWRQADVQAAVRC
jgi:hypothetical protein